MKGSKSTIRSKIFFSYLVIIIISLSLTFLAFNLYLNFYIEKQIKRQLTEAASTIEKSLTEADINLSDSKNSERYLNSDGTLFSTVKDINKKQSFIDAKFALIVGANLNLIYPQKSNPEEYRLLHDNIIPILNEKNGFTNKNGKKVIFHFNVEEKRYASVVYPLKSANKSRNIYLVVYSDLFKTKGFVNTVNNILIFILIIMAVITVLISNNVSKKISRPISLLSIYAKKIGERQYNAEFIKYDDNDEIGQLAKTMEDMVQKLAAYDNTMKVFMQNASHELRTPLMSIQGYAEAIKYGVAAEEDKAVDIIIEESKRLSDLVEDLLYLSKIEGLQDELNLEEVNVEYLIKSSIERVTGIAVQNKKTINFSIKDNSTIIGDEEKLTRAIINILGNCLRYCEEKVDVILKNEELKAIIVIEDDGPGFEEKDLDNIFQRFFKGKGGKHGIGLAITKTIIEKHNGSICAENNSKGGARFTITLNHMNQSESSLL